MSDQNDSTKILPNADQIITRFGGIRPMATKMNVPVTTVQGWKKRNAIPANRAQDIIAAARSYNIAIADLIQPDIAANDTAQASPGTPQPVAERIVTAQPARPPVTPRAAQPQPDRQTQTQNQAQNQAGLDNTASQTLLNEIRKAEKRAVRASLWTAAGVVVLLSGVALLMFWPNARKQEEAEAARLAQIENSVTQLDQHIAEVREEQSFLRTMIPADLQNRVTELQQQAQTVQQAVETLASRADQMAGQVLSSDAGTLGQRLQQLEGQIAQIAQTTGQNGLGSLVARLQTLQSSPEGQTMLSQAATQLSGIMGAPYGTESREQALAATQQVNSDTALGQTLQGISPQDMQAAAMLIALTQFRSAVGRSEPVADDLALLRNVVGSGNPELNASLDKLTPYAESGILSTAGLSTEFKGLAGDIVVASLKGENVSLKERAQARLNDVLKIEKDGQPVTGTETQAKVAQAQHLIDQGRIQEAVALLQTLDGPAAQTASPWIQQAQASLAADDLQGQILGLVMQRLQSGQNPFSAVSGMMPAPQGMQGANPPAAGQPPLESLPQLHFTPGDLNNVTNVIKNAIPGKNAVHDEKSGIDILPQ